MQRVRNIDRFIVNPPSVCFHSFRNFVRAAISAATQSSISSKMSDGKIRLGSNGAGGVGVTELEGAEGTVNLTSE
jgi:hypothetical protein